MPTTLDVPLIEGITLSTGISGDDISTAGWPSINPLFRKKTSTPDLEKESVEAEKVMKNPRKCGFDTVLPSGYVKIAIENGHL